ncbi:MAG: hypothetical protein P8Y95_15945 [Gammaproteobacteria bacterium]|jgi:hypothetical protein
MERVYLAISGTIFGVVALVHLLRALNDWAFVLGAWEIPTVASWIGFVVTASLCAWAVRLAVR